MRPLRQARGQAALLALQGGLLLRPRVPAGGLEGAQEDVRRGAGVAGAAAAAAAAAARVAAVRAGRQNRGGGGARRRRVDPVHWPRQRRQHVLRQLGGAVPAPRAGGVGVPQGGGVPLSAARLRPLRARGLRDPVRGGGGVVARAARDRQTRGALGPILDGRHARLAGARADADREPPRGEHARQPRRDRRRRGGAARAADAHAPSVRLHRHHALHVLGLRPPHPPPRAAGDARAAGGEARRGSVRRAAAAVDIRVGEGRRRARRRLRLRRRQRQRAAADDGRAAARGVHRGGGARPALWPTRARATRRPEG